MVRLFLTERSHPFLYFGERYAEGLVFWKLISVRLIWCYISGKSRYEFLVLKKDEMLICWSEFNLIEIIFEMDRSWVSSLGLILVVQRDELIEGLCIISLRLIRGWVMGGRVSLWNIFSFFNKNNLRKFLWNKKLFVHL